MSNSGNTVCDMLNENETYFYRTSSVYIVGCIITFIHHSDKFQASKSQSWWVRMLVLPSGDKNKYCHLNRTNQEFSVAQILIIRIVFKPVITIM
jgi:hypothetical protein